jgi:hypothetical protein
VTGGGRQDNSLVYPSDARFVTHGGQVGAPLGDHNCSVAPGPVAANPCIRGQWTHVRHGNGNEDGTFHARLFDTINCACLDTNDGAGGVYGSGTVTNGVCNPDDRIAGPEPRRAPANRIAFTGIGQWSQRHSDQGSLPVLFRVDIEDRGEPGGSHPGGGKPPPDRYRIRIWVLSATELSELLGAGPDSHLVNFRNSISACNGINVRDGADVPNGTAVFGVRAPDIDDGGVLQRGNHQIHPASMSCPSTTTGPAAPEAAPPDGAQP